MRPLRWKPVLSLVVAFVAFGATARAEKPVTFPVSVTNNTIWTDGCSFPITVELNSSGTATVFFDASGAPIRVHAHFTEQDTFFANGKTLLGAPYTFNFEFVLDGSGNVISQIADGIAGKVRLPDGGVFITAGRIDFGAQGFPDFIFVPDVGATVNLDGLCAALAP
jgi:hypothetical protein